MTTTSASAFATVSDVILLFRALTADEQTKTEALLPIISNELRYRANLCGLDLDEMIEANEYLSDVAKEVTVTITGRILRSSTTGEPMSQMSQSALGYSVSGTFATPGGGIGSNIYPSDLKRLGIKRQRYGTIDPYAPEESA